MMYPLTFRRLILASLLFIPLVARAESAAVDLPALARQTRRAVLALRTYDLHGRPLASGTAFLVGPDGLAVTSRHVLDAAARVTATTTDGRRFEVRRVVADDAARDLVLLQLAHARDLPVLPLCANDAVPPGAGVAVIGCPSLLGELWTRGIVVGLPELFGHPMLEVTTPFAPGSSGSPVLNGRGEVIGVAHGRYAATADQPALNFAVPVRAVRDLMSPLALAQAAPLARPARYER